MVNSRAHIKAAHEKFVVATFIDEINRRHAANYKVISEPDPPEAIIESNGRTNWIEVTQAFLTEEFAIDAWSHATPNEEPKPMSSPLIVGPDAQFARSLLIAVKKKLEKASYIQFRDAFGPGYLVVSVQNPLFNRRSFKAMDEAWSHQQINDLGCFRSIYLIARQPGGYAVILWRNSAALRKKRSLQA